MANPIIIICRVNASGASGIGVRASGNGTLLLSDVAGSSSSIKVEVGKTLSIYAAQYETVSGSGTIQALRGDRSAWDTDNYPILHAKDIDDGTPEYHVTPGTAIGQGPVWDGDEWIPIDIATQAELDAQINILQSRIASHGFAPNAHSDYVLKSILDAKGDLYVASAANTPGRLVVGTDGQILVADATQTLGVKWSSVADAVPSGGAHLHGLARWNGAAAQTDFELPDFAEYVDWVADNGLMFDPGEDYSLDAAGDTIVLTSGLAEAAVITAGYVIAQV